MSAVIHQEDQTATSGVSTAVLPSDWDAWMRQAGDAASFLQTSIWARINLTVNKARPYYVEVVDLGLRQAAALLAHRLPPRIRFTDRLKTVVSRTGQGWLECFAGPVLLGGDVLHDLDRILGRVDALAEKLRLRRVIFSGRSPTAVWPDADRVRAVFAAHSYTETPQETAVVDLARPDDFLLASFRQAARKGIRRCMDAGIVIRSCDSSEEYLRDFSGPFFEARRAIGFRHEPGRENIHTWDLDPDRHYRYFVARDPAGCVLAVLGTYRWNGLATEIMSERTAIAREQRLPVQDLLHWEAFRTHRDLGDRFFDLAGFRPVPTNEKEAGIRSFKEKWRGRVVQVPRFERFNAPIAFRVARAALSILDGVRD